MVYGSRFLPPSRRLNVDADHEQRNDQNDDDPDDGKEDDHAAPFIPKTNRTNRLRATIDS